jgi:CDP-diglyceride synthetase
MNVDDDAKKVIWSLQNNKRSEEERNVFQPTGKKPIRKEIKYFVVSFFVLLLLSFLLTQFSTDNEEICITEDFCFFSKDNAAYYTLYVFANIVIVILAIAFAYFIGKKLGNLKN